jgi:hypothetical protein
MGDLDVLGPADLDDLDWFFLSMIQPVFEPAKTTLEFLRIDGFT